MYTHFNYSTINPQNFNPTILYISLQDVVVDSQTYPTQDFVTLIYVQQGVCTYIVNNTSYLAKSGDVIVINPGDIHRKIPHPGEKVIEFNMGASDFSIFDLPTNHLISPYADRKIKLDKNRTAFTETYEDIMKVSGNDMTYFGLLIKAEVMKLIALLIREVYSGDTKPSEPQMKFMSNDRKSIVKTILRFLDENYMNEISLETISKNMYLSSVYISKMFKDETGESPINHLIKVRLRNAKDLLESTNYSIRTIAEKVGYNDAYYFSKLFKKYYGISPSQVQKSAIRYD